MLLDRRASRSIPTWCSRPLVFGGGTPGALRHAWQQGHFQPLVSSPTATELLRTLGYPKFELSSAEQEELLADYLPWCETVSIPEPPPTTLTCRDPFDQPFSHLAVVGQADSSLPATPICWP